MNNPTVCVIIPYYNGSKYIERSANSVLAQTIAPNEFLVVDDGSSIEESEKLKYISEKLGFKVLRKENGGQGSARNFGVENTTSDFISFLDQDDFYLKNHIEILLSGIEKNDPHFGWVYADLAEADEDGNIIRWENITHHSRHPKRFISDLIGSDMHILPSASLINRVAFKSVGGFDPQFTGYEDDDLFLRMFRKGYKNYFIDQAVTVWCINNNSTSYSIKMSRSRLKYFKKLVRFFPDEPDKSRYYIKDLIFNRFNSQIIGEAFRSVCVSNTPQSKKMSQHKSELIDIANQYTKIMLNNKYLPLKIKIKIFLQKELINTRSKCILTFCYFVYRKILK
ncbi:MAG: glycosyltransferase family A protein [Acetobacter orientalis]|uniref:glycosyltransferase family 2 protein n=1 Tax=Acetobacter orientalis TaxID=146474 RepID=UPI0039E95231